MLAPQSPCSLEAGRRSRTQWDSVGEKIETLLGARAAGRLGEVVLRTGGGRGCTAAGRHFAMTAAPLSAVVALLVLVGCSSPSRGAAASAQATASAVGSNSAFVASHLSASQASAARQFGALMLQADALNNAPNPQNSVGVGANDLANFATAKTLLTKAFLVLQGVTWPPNIAPDVHTFIASETKVLADVTSFTALPSASVTASPGASLLSEAIVDLEAASNADNRLRADFGLPPSASALASP